ncbi:UTRA domain-containing protein [Bacillus sp. SL00103]
MLPVLQLSNGDAIFELKRIRLANDEPMAIETSYILVLLAGDVTRNI